MSIRGAHNAEGKLVVVAGDQLCRITPAGVAIPLGALPGTGRVQLDHNQISLGNQVMAVNGSAGYLWNTVTDTYGRITDPGFPGGASVRFVSGYFVVIEPQGRYAASSAPADGTSWNTLDRWTSEVSPDPLVAQGVRGQELLLLSSTSGEFFRATANAQQPFRTSRIDFKNVGAAGPHSVFEADGNIFWLGSDGVWYCLDGYSPRRISKRPQEAAIKGLNWDRAFAFRWDTVIYWTFPDGLTWGWDFAEREWHRRESPGLNRWRPNTMTRWDRRWIAGDFQADRLWDCNLEDRYYLEGDSEYIVRRTTGVLSDNQNRLKVNRLGLKMAVGQPLTVPVAFPEQPEGPSLDADPLSLTGWVGDQLEAEFDADDGTPPYTFSLRPGDTLPAGLTLDADGELTGTPTMAGEYTITGRVTDANGLWAEQSIEVVVHPRSVPEWTDFTGMAYADEGGAYLHALAAEDEYANARTSLPLTGLAYVSAQIDIWNSPAAVGISGVVLSVTDALGDGTDSLGLWSDTGDVIVNGSSVGNAGTVTPGVSTQIEIAVNVPDRTVWIRLGGGAWVGGGDPAADTTPTATLTGTGALHLAASINTSDFDWADILLNATADDTSGTVPAGFTAANWGEP